MLAPDDAQRMTGDELQAEFLRLAGIVTSAHNDRLVIEQEMQRRSRQANAKARVAALDAGELEALRSELGVTQAVDVAIAPAAVKTP